MEPRCGLPPIHLFPRGNSHRLWIDSSVHGNKLQKVISEARQGHPRREATSDDSWSSPPPHRTLLVCLDQQSTRALGPPGPRHRSDCYGHPSLFLVSHDENEVQAQQLTNASRRQGMNYIIDCYLFYSNSAIAVNTFVRSIVGAGFPLFARQMYQNIGVDWGSSLLGFLTLVFAPVPILFYLYGEKIRQKSRWAPT